MEQQQQPKKINRLTSMEIFKLYGFIELNKSKWTVDDTYESIAAQVSAAVGRPINKFNVEDAMRQLEVRLPPREKSDSVRIGILKRAVEYLYNDLGLPLPTEWADL